MIAHVIDVGANCWLAIGKFHQISAKNLMSYYQAYPAAFDRINRRIGYRVRPSFIWSYKDSSYLGLIIGFANDGMAGVPRRIEGNRGEPGRKGAHQRLSGCRIPVAGQDSRERHSSYSQPHRLERIETTKLRSRLRECAILCGGLVTRN